MLHQASQAVQKWVILQGVALFAVCFIILRALLFSTASFAGYDDYYHARISAEIAEQGKLAVDFPWLPKTILSPDKFVDHHLLYHLYLAPWVHYVGLEEGAKLGQLVIVAGTFLALWLLLRQIQVRYALGWTLTLFALSSSFLYRMLMIRTQAASVLLLILALSLLFGRRYRWLIPLSFAYVWLYDGFILMPIFAGLYTISEWLSDRRLDWRPLTYTLMGVALGLIINPYFPRNLEFITDHLGAKVGFESGVEVGSEWYPYTTGALLANSGGALLILVLGFLRPSIDSHRRDRIENTLLFAALLTLFMLFRSRRFIEYYPPFALLFCAAAWGRQPLILPVPRRLGFLVPLGAVVAAIILAQLTWLKTRETLERGDNPSWFVGASNWLDRNAPDGAMVFQTDWDDFTRLFYHNPSNIYLVGLDPTYLERADPDLWTQWVAITRGEVELPSSVIRSAFDAEYVVSDRRHTAFADRANADPDMRLVYWDRDSNVWQIIADE
jgi:hypothetical protein